MGNYLSRTVKAVLGFVESLITGKDEEMHPVIRHLKKFFISLIVAAIAMAAKKVKSSRTMQATLGGIAIAGIVLFLVIWYRGWSPNSLGRDRRPVEPVAVDSGRLGDHGYDTCKDVASCEVQLPDGSTAILQAYSSIRYTPDFEGERREVYLTGNAAFRVISNAAKPFIVHDGSIIIRVLGTFFNLITDSSDDRLELTVISGCVQVIAGRVKRRVDSAWQAVMEGGMITMSKPDSPTSCLRWAEENPYLDFHETKLTVVIGRIARWHHVTVYNPEHVCGIPLTGTFQFSDSIREDVKVLQRKELWYVRLEFKNDTIFIYKSKA